MEQYQTAYEGAVSEIIAAFDELMVGKSFGEMLATPIGPRLSGAINWARYLHSLQSDVPIPTTPALPRRYPVGGPGVIFKGMTFPSQNALARHLGIRPQALSYRLRAGWSEEDLARPTSYRNAVLRRKP